MQISTGATVSNASARSGGAATLFKRTTDDRINGGVPIWQSAADRQKNIAATAVEEKLAEEKIVQTKTDSFAALVEQPVPAPVTDPAKPAGQSSPLQTPAKEKSSFGFLDLVDMINPLQHIPVVGAVYRGITGDEIKPFSKVVGGAAFGGVLGAATGLVDAFVQTISGQDIGEHVSTDLAALGSNSPNENADENAAAAFSNLKHRSVYNA